MTFHRLKRKLKRKMKQLTLQEKSSIESLNVTEIVVEVVVVVLQTTTTYRKYCIIKIVCIINCK